ncbi:hypothetical protein [Streptomyces scabiei]|uniref:hypothetical protein n=1 Tax=Streptomyces scabiei TaxID=1930 RepID=UPI0029AB234F|nr:hypothetical protein [Streptomyces scabiei]MDX3522684.1 hypothetical protein [Streptomyces scabiei]
MTAREIPSTAREFSPSSTMLDSAGAPQCAPDCGRTFGLDDFYDWSPAGPCRFARGAVTDVMAPL